MVPAVTAPSAKDWEIDAAAPLGPSPPMIPTRPPAGPAVATTGLRAKLWVMLESKTDPIRPPTCVSPVTAPDAELVVTAASLMPPAMPPTFCVPRTVAPDTLPVSAPPIRLPTIPPVVSCPTTAPLTVLKAIVELVAWPTSAPVLSPPVILALVRVTPWIRAPLVTPKRPAPATGVLIVRLAISGGPPSSVSVVPTNVPVKGVAADPIGVKAPAADASMDVPSA